MLNYTLNELQERAKAYVHGIASATAVHSDVYVGAGSAPESHIASIAVAIDAPDVAGLSKALRCRGPHIVGRIEEHRLLLDLRTVAPEEDEVVISEVQHCLLQQ